MEKAGNFLSYMYCWQRNTFLSGYRYVWFSLIPISGVGGTNQTKRVVKQFWTDAHVNTSQTMSLLDTCPISTISVSYMGLQISQTQLFPHIMML